MGIRHNRFSPVWLPGILLLALGACRGLAPAAAPTATPIPAPTQALPAATATGVVPTALPTPTLAAPASDPLVAGWDDRSFFRQGLVQMEQSAPERLSGASIYHIDLEITPDYSQVRGRQQVRYTNQETLPLHEVYFRLFANALGGDINVSGVEVDGQAVVTALESGGTALRVSLPTALQPGHSTVVQMDFIVQIPVTLGGAYGLLSYLDGVLALDSIYPSIPVYDERGWHIEPPPDNADLTYADVSFYLVRVTAPSQLVIAAAGVEVGRETRGDHQVVTFAAGPGRDFYLAAGERLQAISQVVGETHIYSYALRGQEAAAQLALQTAARAIQSYSARFGSYPYTEFDVVSTPMNALGIEYPGIVGITMSLYNDQAAAGDTRTRAMLEATVAHETAHQWFYNLVGNDQIDEPWVDESLTQYATGLYFIDQYGQARAQGYLNSWQERWAGVDQAKLPVGLPAAKYTPQEYGAIVYGRGPLFYQAMAGRIGQTVMDRFLWDYATTYRWKITTGADIRQTAERECGCDLAPMFQEWVNGK